MTDHLQKIVGRKLMRIDVLQEYISLEISGGYFLHIMNNNVINLAINFPKDNEIKRIEDRFDKISLIIGQESYIDIFLDDQNYNSPEIFILKTPTQIFVETIG